MDWWRWLHRLCHLAQAYIPRRTAFLSQALAAECEAARLRLLDYFQCDIWWSIWSGSCGVGRVLGRILGRFLGEFWEGNFFSIPHLHSHPCMTSRLLKALKCFLSKAALSVRFDLGEKWSAGRYFCISLWSSYRLHTALVSQDMD